MLKFCTIVLSIVLGCCFAKKLPSDIPLCKVEDVECIAKVTTQLLHTHPNGRPELGIPVLDPLRVAHVKIDQGSTGPLNLDLSFKDLDVIGLSKIDVYKAVGFGKDPKTSKFEFNAKLPQLSFKGKYRANGRILILPIQGEGGTSIVLDDVTADIRFKPTVTEKNGQQFLGIDKLKVRLSPSKMSVKLENLFNGDKTLGDNMNTFINENWKDVWEELAPGVNSAIAEILKSIVKHLFTKFSYDDIYAD